VKREKENKEVMGMFEQIIRSEPEYKSINLQRSVDTNKANYYIDGITNNLFSMFSAGYYFGKHVCKSVEQVDEERRR